MPKTCSERAAPETTRVVLHGPTMGTRWSATCELAPQIDARALQRDLAATVERVDAQMSPWRSDSCLVQLNQAPVGAWFALTTEMLQILACALDIGRLSQGAFDIGVGALVDAWGFGAARSAPDASAIRAARALAHGPAHETLELGLHAGRARKLAPLQIDLCGIAKGYAVDRMAEVLQHHGVAQALAALDGELRAIGGQADGRPWAVAIESPQTGLRRAHGVLALQDLAVATSGDYRHFFDVNGQRLAHSMDARSGTPVRGDVASVTVLAANCMLADAWATALLVAGAAQGLALAQRHGLEALWLLRRGGALVELGLGRFGGA